MTRKRYHAWLRRRERSIGLKGWKALQDKDWWRGPPNERAARMICHKLALSIDWRRVLNIVSEAKKGR